MRTLLLMSVVILAGCSDDDYGTALKDLATGGDASVTVDGGPAKCDVVTQDCAAGEKCTLVSPDQFSAVTACEPASGSDALDMPCTSTADNDSCQKGLFCSSRGWPSNASGALLHCNKLCAKDSDCRTGEACTIETDDGLIGVCVKRCQPFDTSCGAGEDCSTFYDDTDSTDAVEDFVWACRSVVGSGAPGANCTDDTDCAAHSICDDASICAQLCDATNSCPGGDGGLNCTSFDNVNPLGICE
jgi:hypothetical protein